MVIVKHVTIFFIHKNYFQSIKNFKKLKNNNNNIFIHAKLIVNSFAKH